MTEHRKEGEGEARGVDCQVFQDQLDGLVGGSLPEEGRVQLQLHAASCPDCAMQLKVQEHLMGPTMAELENDVPEEMVASMWSGVRTELGSRTVGLEARSRRTPSRVRAAPSWLVPLLAAACVALLFSTGFLFTEVNRMKERETTLAQQVHEQRQWLAELGRGVTDDPVVRTAALAGRNPMTRALAREEEMTVDRLRQMLRALPAQRTLVDAAQLRALLQDASKPLPPLWRNILADLGAADGGVRAGDLLRALEADEIPPGTRVRTADLIDFLS